MIEKNIREDTPNIMVSNEASVDQPPSKGSFMNVNEQTPPSEEVVKEIADQDILIVEK